jgi:peptidoglycan/xylan/chitin deacetylase (PgdA/CDA1 family)
MISTQAMLIVSLLVLVVVLLFFATYYDYRYRRHWTGFAFGYPLHGVDGQLFFSYDDGPALFGKVTKLDDDSQPISDPKVRQLILNDISDYDFSKTITENLLDLLKAHQAKAVFFLCGKSIEAYPNAKSLINRMLSEGHCIGNHSFSHGYARKNPIADVLADFARNHELIASLTGHAARLFRPPYGDWEPEFSKKFLAHPVLKRYSFPIFWTTMFREWALQSADDLTQLGERILGFEKSCADRKGKILLLHDSYIAAIIITARILRDHQQLGYVVGDPATLAHADRMETDLYRRLPFLYYLKNLKDRALLKLSRGERTHTNYRMEQ